MCVIGLVLPLCDWSNSEWPFETVPLLHKIIITYELEVAAVFDMIRVCICQGHSCKPSYNLTERTDENQSGDVPESLFYVQCQRLILLTWQVCGCRGNLEGPPQHMGSTICGEGKRDVFDNHMTWFIYKYHFQAKWRKLCFGYFYKIQIYIWIHYHLKVWG